MAIAYGVIFAMALLISPLYFVFVSKKQSEPWLFILFVCVAIVNLGYLLIAVSKTVEFALFANKIAYLGQVFIPLCMFRLISKLCGFKTNKWVTYVLIGLAFIMFAIVCTSGYLDWYYKSVTLEYADGASFLKKEYGVLHPTNLIYVLAYTVACLAIIGVSLKRNKGASQKLAMLMLAVVIGNICMWVIEKIVSWNFELLAVSYLMSELVFFFTYVILQDYVRKDDLPAPVIVEQKVPIIIVDSETKEEKIKTILEALPKGATLSVRQMDVLEGIIDGKSRKEMAADLHLSENTVKMHTSSLYRLLGVSSRDELKALLKK